MGPRQRGVPPIGKGPGDTAPLDPDKRDVVVLVPETYPQEHIPVRGRDGFLKGRSISVTAHSGQSCEGPVENPPGCTRPGPLGQLQEEGQDLGPRILQESIHHERPGCLMAAELGILQRVPERYEDMENPDPVPFGADRQGQGEGLLRMPPDPVHQMPHPRSYCVPGLGIHAIDEANVQGLDLSLPGLGQRMEDRPGLSLTERSQGQCRRFRGRGGDAVPAASGKGRDESQQQSGYIFSHVVAPPTLSLTDAGRVCQDDAGVHFW